jgi:SAM-dependent methyltransferase
MEDKPAEKVEQKDPANAYALPLKAEVAEALIKDVYKDISGFGLNAVESAKISSKGGNATYGEILFSSLQTLLYELNLTKDDTFYDLGSGVGKACMQVALVTPARAVGVELSPSRTAKAREALKRVENSYHIKSKVEFKEENITDVTMKKSAVVFTCSACFPDKLLNDIAEKCKKTPGMVRVLSLKALPGLTPVKVYKLPMTWTLQTDVFYYVLAND